MQREHNKSPIQPLGEKGVTLQIEVSKKKAERIQ